MAIARYWVSTGTGNVNSTTNWSTTSGGASGASVPTAADDAIFDANSGTNTVTVNVAFSVHSWIMTGSGARTVTGAGALTIGGGATTTAAAVFTLVSGITFGNTFSGGITLDNRSGGMTITTGGISLSGVTGGFQNSNQVATYTWADTVNGQGITFTCARGTWVISSGTTFNCATLAITGATSEVKTINYTGATINITTSWGMGNNTGDIAIIGNSSSKINLAAGATFSGAGQTYPGTVTCTAAGANTIYGGHLTSGAYVANTFTNLTLIGANQPSISNLVLFEGSNTITGVFTATGYSQNDRLEIAQYNYPATTVAPVTLTTNGTISISNTDFWRITAAGTAAPWTGTSLGDRNGNSGITFTTPTTCYYVGGTNSWCTINTWATTSGGTPGSAGCPLPQDTVIFDANSIPSANTTVPQNSAYLGALNTSAVTATNFIISQGAKAGVHINSNVVLSSNTTYSMASVNAYFFVYGSGTITITENGGAITLAAASNSSCSFYTHTVISGPGSFSGCEFLVYGTTLDISSANCLMGALATHSGETILFGPYWYTFNSTYAAQPLLNLTGATISNISGLANAEFFTNGTNAGVVSLTCNAGATGLTLYALVALSGSVAVTGGSSGTITTLAISPGATFSGTSSSTIIVDAIEAIGVSGNLITINAVTAGTAFTLSSPAGIVNCDWLSLQDCTASGGATFYGGANSTVVSNVTGWTAGSGPARKQLTSMGCG